MRIGTFPEAAFTFYPLLKSANPFTYKTEDWFELPKNKTE